jgi:nicotinate dehydrogenase subunit B
VTYGALLGGKRFDLTVSDSAPVKPARDYRLVGAAVPRRDLPDKVSGRHVYMQHVRVPGMLHGRVVRPRGQTAHGVTPKVMAIDESSIRGIPARIVRRGDFVGVVAEREWDAVRAARDLVVTWDAPASLPGSDRVHDRMRAEATQDRVVLEKGSVDAACASAAHVVTQVGRGPYQAHAAFGPNCAVADVRAD